MNLKTLTFCILVILFTTSCSGTYHAYYQTLKLAFAEQPNATISLTDVQKSTVDLISVKRGERPIAIMALAYLENGQHKWISNDKAMLIMEQGRIVRTVGLKENLLYLSNTESDPLKSFPANTPANMSENGWQRLADWSGDQYGFPLESTFTTRTNNTLQALSVNIDTLRFVEKVNFLAPANFMRLNTTWENHFWYDKQSGELLKSIERTSPLSEPLEIIYLSRIARLSH